MRRMALALVLVTVMRGTSAVAQRADPAGPTSAELADERFVAALMSCVRRHAADSGVEPGPDARREDFRAAVRECTAYLRDVGHRRREARRGDNGGWVPRVIPLTPE